MVCLTGLEGKAAEKLPGRHHGLKPAHDLDFLALLLLLCSTAALMANTCPVLLPRIGRVYT
jgi:hypothetical protein